MRLCILLVDDEIQIDIAMIRAFARVWSITVCTTGEDALEVLKSPALFDAILLDLMLGEMGGLELYDRMPAARKDRVIFCTGAAGHPTLVPELNRLGRPVISKPFSLDAIQRSVELVAKRQGPRGPTYRDPNLDLETLFTELETRMVSAIRDVATAKGSSIPPEPKTDPHGRSTSLAAIADDEDDASVERTDHGGLRIPPGSWLEKEINTVLEKREKLVALELAAGRWAWLRKWWYEWWRRLALAVLVGGAGFAVREIGELFAWCFGKVKR